jgi:hypothetical protein
VRALCIARRCCIIKLSGAINAEERNSANRIYNDNDSVHLCCVCVFAFNLDFRQYLAPRIECACTAADRFHTH